MQWARQWEIMRQSNLTWAGGSLAVGLIAGYYFGRRHCPRYADGISAIRDIPPTLVALTKTLTALHETLGNSAQLATKPDQPSTIRTQRRARRSVKVAEFPDEYSDESGVDTDYVSAPEEEIVSSDTVVVPEVSGGSRELLRAFEKADKLNAAAKVEECLKFLVDLNVKHKGEADVLWRLARAHFDVSEANKANAERRKQSLDEALKFANAALSADEANFAAHKWYAIICTSAASDGGTKEKIMRAYEFREHIERSIELKQDDATSHHLLGRWCMEVCALSWLERKAASALFATPPTATVEEAIGHFMQAEDISPGFWKMNQLMIGKAYLRMGNRPEATKWVQRAIALPVVSVEDRESHEEALSILNNR